MELLTGEIIFNTITSHVNVQVHQILLVQSMMEKLFTNRWEQIKFGTVSASVVFFFPQWKSPQNIKLQQLQWESWDKSPRNFPNKKKSLFKDKSRYKNESILFLLWVWHHLNSTLVDQRNILLQGEAKYKLTVKSLFCPLFGDFNHYRPLFFYFNIGLRNLCFHFNFQSKAFFF